jgi:hypothetical protein
MAKVAAKTPAKAPRKTASKPQSGVSDGEKIEKACLDALEKLKALGIDQQLQNDIEWCLGSYRSDNNPIGLYDMAKRALIIFQQEKIKKTKGITSKMLTDLEKAIGSN